MAYSTCTQCDKTYSGMTAFDAHHASVGDARGSVRCKSAEETGLVFRNGVYGFPGDGNTVVIQKERDPVANIRECATCGAEFEKPAGRGRPPKNCPSCR